MENRGNFLKKYVSLKPSVEMHLTPEGAYIIENGCLKGAVNREGAKVFLLCNGMRTVEQVFFESGLASSIKDSTNKNKLCNPSVEEKLSGYLKFIECAVTYGDLNLSDEKVESYLTITGSDEFYVPIHLMAEVTRRCNLACKHCYVARSNFERELSTSEFLSVLEEFAELGVRTIELTGGEPTIKPGFPYLLGESFEMFDTVAILTNGYAVSREIVEILRLFRDRCYVNVSLDSYRPEYHNSFRGRPDAFERTTRTIRELTKHGIRVRVAMTVTRENLNDLEKTLLLAKELGAIAFSWSPIVPFGKGEELTDLSLFSDPEFMRVSEELVKKYPEFTATLEDAELNMVDLVGNCGLGWKSLVVDPQGRLRPCSFLDSSEFVIGNAAEEKLSDILSRDVVFALRELKSPGEKTCKNCKYAMFCKGCVVKGLKMALAGNECSWLKSQKREVLANVLPYLFSGI